LGIWGFAGMCKTYFTAFITTAWIAIGILAARAEPLILNCEIESGAPEGYRSIQIMIDEAEKVVVYNYQLLKGRGYVQKSGDGTIDMSMKVEINNNDFILANDATGAIVITKRDGKFVKAWAMPVPTNDGNWEAFGNTHWGKCIKSPF